MKLNFTKSLLIATICLFGVNAHAQMESAKQTYESPKLETEKAKHTLVAILPFETKISYRRQPKNFSAEANKAQEESMSRSIQSSMYTFLLRKHSSYTVSFQDIEKTNVLLKKAGMLDKLDEYTKDEIAKVLGVDAILGGRFETEQTKSDGVALAATMLIGSMGSKTGSGTLALTLYNGSDGELLWRFFKTMNDSFLSSTDVLIERMMRKVSRNFPYSK